METFQHLTFNYDAKLIMKSASSKLVAQVVTFMNIQNIVPTIHTESTLLTIRAINVVED